jgi:transposase-like protein
MGKERTERGKFICDECQRHFDLDLLYSRDNKRYCPTCYLNTYDEWDCLESDGFEQVKKSGFLGRVLQTMLGNTSLGRLLL